jgi:DNA primase
VDPRGRTIATVPGRLARLGDPHEGIDEAVHSLETLRGWADRDRLK